MDKENSKKLLQTGIFNSKKNSKKTIYFSRSKSNSRGNLNIHGQSVNNSTIKRKSVSPINVSASLRYNNNKNANKKPEILSAIKDVENKELPKTNSLIITKNSTPTLEKNSSKKRKFNELENEQILMTSDFQQVIKDLNIIHNEFNDELAWKENFRNVIGVHIIEENKLYPKSITPTGSKLLEFEKFWILWIASINTFQVTLENLIELFNLSFNYVTTESLIKSYFLKTMREIERQVLVAFLESKGIHLYQDNPSSCNSNLITNKILFSLLDLNAQFMLRVKKPSDSKKLKRINESYEKLKDSIDANINHLSRKNFSELHKCHQFSVCFEESHKAEVNKSQDQKQISQLTESHRKQDNTSSIKNESYIKNSASSSGFNSKNKNENKTLNVEESDQKVFSEIKDSVESIQNFTQNTQNMIISQATIQNQIEFMSKIQLANYKNITNISSVVKNDSRFIDLTLDGLNFIKEDSNINNCSVIPNVTQDTINLCDNITSNDYNPIDHNELTTVEDRIKFDVTQINETSLKENITINNCLFSNEEGENLVSPMNKEFNELEKSFMITESQDVLTKIEEPLDVIRELPESQIDKDEAAEVHDVINTYKALNKNTMNLANQNYASENRDHLNSSYSSKSCSQSLTKNFHSNFTECYPDDIVEGSIIKTLNKSYKKVHEESKNTDSKSELIESVKKQILF